MSTDIAPGTVLDAMVAELVYGFPCYSPGVQEDDARVPALLDTYQFPCFVAFTGVIDGKAEQVPYLFKTKTHYAYWSPSRNPEFAKSVIERMAKHGLWFSCHSPWRPGDKWWGGFTPHGVTGWNGRPDSNMSGVSFEHVVCLSAIRWFEDEEEMKKAPHEEHVTP